MINDILHEECGVFGTSSPPDTDFQAAYSSYTALFALQHRGQHSAGIAVSDGKKISYKKGDGLVHEVFDGKSLELLHGHESISHVRYASKQGTSGVNAQPIVISHGGDEIALCFNGALTNSHHLRAETEERGGIFQTTGDAEIMLYIIVRAFLKTGSLESAVLIAMRELQGAFSILILTKNKMIAMRDPHGFRPLCVGKLGSSMIVASESCGLDSIGAVMLRDVAPGEVLVFEQGKMRSLDSGIKASESLCIFEHIYFARPDSVIDGVSVELARQEAGRCLGRVDMEDGDFLPDIVIGVPDSGLSAALGYSQQTGVPYANGFIKNRYIGRTFIQSSQGQREQSVRIKLNAMSSVVKGKRVMMIDDSIVRGTTIAHIVSILREAGAKEVHFRISSPPFKYPCFFGTDIPSRDQLIANRMTVDEIARKFDIDSLKYLRFSDLDKISAGLTCGYCHACFSGKYSLPIQ